MKVKIAPSILSADFANLKSDVQKIEPLSGMLHIDVMDGHFVPNISIGVPVVRSLKKITNLPLDVHLMITDPIDYVDAFADAGADILTFHIEANGNPAETIKKIKSRGMKAGISMKPGTPVSEIESYLDDVDMVLVMTVEPGFAGQSFMDMSEKIKDIRGKKENLDIQVDGGIGKDTAKKVVDAGANVLVAGSAVFGKEDPAKAIEEIKSTYE